MYTILCDNCGKDACEDTEYAAWGDPNIVLEWSCENWVQEGDKHYCPDCFSYDDDDNVVLKTLNP